ncbi:MAG: 6,7-dimethyl-8-ribityllumazine synthase [Bacteroidetes bacterium]|nr:6,7-dimethyl-8-ribityllumazine synthase [Bacteroidota bacterium]
MPVYKHFMPVKSEPSAEFEFLPVKKAEKLHIGIVVSEWNIKITSSLLRKCIETLEKFGISENHIELKWIPGSYELSLAAQWMFEYRNVDGVACLGCIIQGETPHFQFISESVALTIGQLAIKYNRPAAFGVITAETEKQALDRAGGKAGNKGEEAALALLKMLKVKSDLAEPKSSLGFK